MTIAVLGTEAARVHRDELAECDQVIVIEPSVDELERLLEEFADPRYDYLLGELPVLPLPDGCVDRVVGPEHPEVARVTAA
jgi:hypothetical protein